MHLPYRGTSPWLPSTFHDFSSCYIDFAAIFRGRKTAVTVTKKLKAKQSRHLIIECLKGMLWLHFSVMAKLSGSVSLIIVYKSKCFRSGAWHKTTGDRYMRFFSCSRTNCIVHHFSRFIFGALHRDGILPSKWGYISCNDLLSTMTLCRLIIKEQRQLII